MSIVNNRLLIMVELLILAVVIPTIVIAYKLAPKLLLFLWLTTIYCIVIYSFIASPNWREVWNWRAVTKDNLNPILIRWLIVTLLLLIFTWGLFPEKLFQIQRERPHVLAVILFAYPILSALPQEFIFCTYFFKRYQRFFGSGQMMLLASAIVFAYAHVLFINWVAPLLSLCAGLIFAHTYQTRQSLALVTIEHALYGNSLFFIGLGWFFWGGSVRG